MTLERYCRCRRVVDSTVPGMRRSGRTRSLRDGCSLRRRNDRARLGASGWSALASGAGRSMVVTGARRRDDCYRFSSGSSIIKPSSPRIAQNAHSGVSPIIGIAADARRNGRLCLRSDARGQAALAADLAAGIWRRCRVADAPARDSACRRRLTTTPGRRQCRAMWACVSPSSRTVW